MKLLEYTAMFTTLLTAILLPADSSFWIGCLRGICLGIFITLIPAWVDQHRNNEVV